MMRVPHIDDYPKKIHLRGESYTLKFVTGLKSLGETDASAKEIRIRSGMSKNETFRTVLHELFHFIEFEWPIDELTHKTIYKLEKAVFQLIIDNFI